MDGGPHLAFVFEIQKRTARRYLEEHEAVMKVGQISVQRNIIFMTLSVSVITWYSLTMYPSM